MSTIDRLKMSPLYFETCGLLMVEERCVYVFPYHVISSNGDEKFSYFLSKLSKFSKNVYLFLKGLIHCHM